MAYYLGLHVQELANLIASGNEAVLDADGHMPLVPRVECVFVDCAGCGPVHPDAHYEGGEYIKRIEGTATNMKRPFCRRRGDIAPEKRDDWQEVQDLCQGNERGHRGAKPVAAIEPTAA